MEKGWKPVFLTTLEHQVAIAQSILSENGIPSVVINRKDSAYLAFGEETIYVEEHFEAQAVELLKELKS
jgi:hypothetical protein